MSGIDTICFLDYTVYLNISAALGKHGSQALACCSSGLKEGERLVERYQYWDIDSNRLQELATKQRSIFVIGAWAYWRIAHTQLPIAIFVSTAVAILTQDLS